MCTSQIGNNPIGTTDGNADILITKIVSTLDKIIISISGRLLNSFSCVRKLKLSSVDLYYLRMQTSNSFQ